MVQANRRYFARKTNRGWVVCADAPKNSTGRIFADDIIACESSGNFKLVFPDRPTFKFMDNIEALNLPLGSEAWVKFYGKTITCACGKNHEVNELQRDREGVLGIDFFQLIEQKQEMTLQDALRGLPQEMPLSEAIHYFTNEMMKQTMPRPRYPLGTFEHSPEQFSKRIAGLFNNPDSHGDVLRPGMPRKPIEEMLDSLKAGESILNKQKPTQEFIDNMKAVISKQHGIPVEKINFEGVHNHEIFFSVKREQHPAAEELKAQNPKLHKLVEKTLRKLVELHPGDPVAGRLANALQKSYTRANKKKA